MSDQSVQDIKKTRQYVQQDTSDQKRKCRMYQKKTMGRNTTQSMMNHFQKKTTGGPEKNQGMRDVLDVTDGSQFDNFFTSYELRHQLLKRKINMVGPVGKNKPELPPALLTPNDREIFSSKFAFKPTTTLVSYLPKKNKNVVLLSTLLLDANISDGEDRKPAIILDYKCTKGGVDKLDKVIGRYSYRSMTACWPLVILHNSIDVSSCDAFVIWRKINPDLDTS